MSLRLNGSTSGYVEIDAPAVAGTTSITLPTTPGEAIIKATDGSVDLGSVDIDSSGRLLVGTSSAASAGAYAQNSLLQVRGNAGSSAGTPSLSLQRGAAAASMAANSGAGAIAFSDNAGNEFGWIECLVDGTTGSGDHPGRLVFSTTADGASSPTERMRIHSDGGISTNGLTAAPSASSFGTYIGRLSAGRFETFYNATGTGTVAQIGGTAGYALVRGDGDLENTNNRYTGLSDIKLKQNIEDASSQWDDIKGIKVRKYELIANPDRKHIGVVAQELEQVCPGLVIERIQDEETGETVKSVAYSVLYMKAVKALQEAMERIETLEQRLSDAGIA